MKLADLNPRWITPSQWAPSSPPFYVGASFLCPCEKCRVTTACPTCGHLPERQRLVVMFHPPIDPGGLEAKYGEGWWTRKSTDHQRVSGETFESLTIAPSIGFDSIGHWHGTINAGECNP